MIGALMFLNMRGDIALSRTFRDGFSARALAIAFRNDLISTKLLERSPVNIIDHFCFMHLKLTELYLVLVADANVDCLAAQQYGLRLLQIIHASYGRISESVLKENFVALQFLIEESADFGYPTLTDREAIGLFLPPHGLVEYVVTTTEDAEQVTARLTGDMPWRVPGLFYSVNEMFVDVIEDVNLLLSPTGEVLQSNVVGRVTVNDFLTGMPECELLLNANTYGAAPAIGTAAAAGASGEEGAAPAAAVTELTTEPSPKLSDVTFHTCVRLGPANEPQSIRFVPPDGEFTLMTYQAAVSIEPPMCITAAHVKEVSRTRTQIEYALKSNFAAGQTATNVEVLVPCPENTATVNVKVKKGRATYVAVRHAIVWTLDRVKAGEEIPFVAEIRQLAPTAAEESVWSRPPITIAFECVTQSLTGIKISELRVHEPEYLYAANKWIRYTTKAGDYQCRI